MASSTMTEENQDITAKTDFTALAAAGDWRAVISAAENLERSVAGTERVDILAARLWWATAQLALGSVPPSILAAPLESAADELCTTELHTKYQDLAQLAGAALTKLAIQLESNDDAEAALRLRRLAFRADSSFGPALRIALGRAIGELESDPLLKCDFTRSDRLRELKLLVASMEATDPSVSESMTEQVISTDPASSPDLNWVLSSTVVDHDAQTVSDYSSSAFSSQPQSMKIPPSRLRPGMTLKHIGIGATVFVILVLLIVRYSADISSGSIPWNIASVGKIVDQIRGVDSEDVRVSVSDTPAAPLLRSPGADRAVSNNLDALYYDISSQQEARETAAPAEVVKAGAPLQDGASAPSSSAAKESAAINQAALKPGKETLNTSEPREDRAFKERLDRAQSRSRTEEVRPQPAKDRPIFPEPPQRRREPAPTRDRQASNGSRYTIVARTSVMARPEYDAIRLTELRPGDEIEVETRMGNWLRILSRNGVYGFVLAQDARAR